MGKKASKLEFLLRLKTPIKYEKIHRPSLWICKRVKKHRIKLPLCALHVTKPNKLVKFNSKIITVLFYRIKSIVLFRLAFVALHCIVITDSMLHENNTQPFYVLYPGILNSLMETFQGISTGRSDGVLKNILGNLHNTKLFVDQRS